MSASNTSRQMAGSGDAADQRDAELLGMVLVCPLDMGEFDHDQERFTCRICGRTYPVRDGIADLTLRRDE